MLYLVLLAYVFKKFPELWNMNFMWIRHRVKRGGIKRSHRLSEFAEHRTDFLNKYFVKVIA